MNKDSIKKKMKHIVGKTINTNDLILKDEIVLVALSGGIDSLVLLDILHERKKHIPIDYTIMALHVNVSDVEYHSDPDEMKDFCIKRSIHYKEIKAKLQYSESSDKISICNSCSRLRRKIIFDYAEENSCFKIAFGHHMDDALETMLLNMTYSSTLSSLPPKLNIFKEKLSIIRPLLNCSKDDILAYAEKCEIEPINKGCPHEEISKREKMRSILAQIHENDPKLKRNLFKSMSNIHKDYLP